MKRKILIISSLLVLATWGIVYAFKPKTYIPVIVERTAFETSVASIDVQKIKNPGKIVVRGNVLFIVEKYLGVHIINNINPAQPQNIGFIRILGCIDVAVKNNTMFASSAVDLVTIDIADLLNAKEISRQKNVFPELQNPEGVVPWEYSESERPQNTIIIAWK